MGGGGDTERDGAEGVPRLLASGLWSQGVSVPWFVPFGSCGA